MKTTVSMSHVILYVFVILSPLLFWLNHPLSSREFRWAKSERLRQLFWRWLKWSYLWGIIGGVVLLVTCKLGRGDVPLYLLATYLAVLWLSGFVVITAISYYWLNQIIRLNLIDRIGIFCLLIGCSIIILSVLMRAEWLLSASGPLSVTAASIRAWGEARGRRRLVVIGFMTLLAMAIWGLWFRSILDWAWIR